MKIKNKQKKTKFMLLMRFFYLDFLHIDNQIIFVKIIHRENVMKKKIIEKMKNRILHKKQNIHFK